MRITGKILGESPIYLRTTLLKCVSTGSQVILLVNMRTGVKCKAIVAVVMAGKSKSSIL